MKCLAEVKDSLDIEVKQNFIDPLQNLCDKDLKEIQVCLDVLSLMPTPRIALRDPTWLPHSVSLFPSWAPAQLTSVHTCCEQGCKALGGPAM